MSGTHNKLQYGYKFNHWKFSDLVLDLSYFSFSQPIPNPTYLPKHEFHSTNIHSTYLVCRILLCACVHGVKSEISQVRNFAWHRIRSHLSCLPAVPDRVLTYQRLPESLFQTPTPLLFQNFLIRVRLFFKFENPTLVQTPATIIHPTIICP